MSTPYEVDLDAESIRFDGEAHTRESLAKKIKGMIDAGDYQVARPSAALEALTAALSGVRTVSVKLGADLADTLNAEAARQRRPPGSLIRDALTGFLRAGGVSPAAERQASMPAAPLAGPGALASSGVTTEPVSPEEAANAVSLTPKKKDEDRGSAEKRWFGR